MNPAKYIFSLTLVLCSIVALQAQPKDGTVIDQVISIVGNNTILKSEIEIKYLQNKAQGTLGEGDPNCAILEEMLFEKLLITQADLDSLQVPDKEIEGELDRRMSMIIAQAGSEEKLELYYNKKIREIKAEIKDIIKDQLLAHKMEQKLTKDIKLTPSDVQRYFRTLPKDSLPQINSNTEIQQIVMYPKINDAQKIEIREKLEALRKRILDGEKFSTLAVMYSDDPGSARNGGELGFVGRTDLISSFAGPAFKLKEPGDVSRIVETDRGYHIIQLIERKGEKINCRHILMTPKVAPEEVVKVGKRMDSLYVQIKQDSLKIDDAIARFSEDEKSKNNNGMMYNQYSGSTKFEDDQIDPKTRSMIQDLKIDELSKAFETKEEIEKQVFKTVYKIVCVKSRTKSHTANLKDDYKEIQEMAMAAERQRVVKEWIKKKIESTYVHIDDSYKNCKFNYGKWAK